MPRIHINSTEREDIIFLFFNHQKTLLEADAVSKNTGKPLVKGEDSVRLTSLY